MTNVDRLAKHIAKYGMSNMMIHKMPKSRTWLVVQKTETNMWKLVIMNPHATKQHEIGIMTEEEYRKIEEQITEIEINNNKKRKQRNELLTNL